MALIPWRGASMPGGTLASLRQEMNDLLNRFWSSSAEPFGLAEWSPAVDVSETDDAVLVHVEVPGIDPKELDEYWPVASRNIEPALDEEISIEDAYAKIQSGKMGLFVVGDDAAGVCEVVHYPRLKALRVVALGGTGMALWLPHVIAFLDDWAASIGADRVEQMGRKGWLKVLSKYGYRERYTFMTKELDNG